MFMFFLVLLKWYNFVVVLLHKVTTQHNGLEQNYIKTAQQNYCKDGSLNWSLGNKSLSTIIYSLKLLSQKSISSMLPTQS